ncbi:MAG TPA: tetratricopeptide repeat protein [Gallionella sp.]
MSLLLDARKKSQQAQGASGLELSLEDIPASSLHPQQPTPPVQPVEHARRAGQNLFNAKTHSPALARASVNRNLLIALGGSLLLFAAGAGYVWYEITPHNTRPARPAPPPAVAQPAMAQPSAPAAPQPPATGSVTEKPVVVATPPERPAARIQAAPKRNPPPLHVEKIQPESIDPLLRDAYLAYQSGQLDQAQQLYQRAHRLDTRNGDALLGLAAIAQQLGSDNVAAHYYLKVLELDPRDPVANAGMSALTTGANGESRLKLLLNEQPGSSALHAALGNRYAEQSRWGDAQQSYFNAYKLEPKNPDLAFNLAVSLDRLGQKKLAAQYYQLAIELDQKRSAGFDHALISKRIEELNQ